MRYKVESYNAEYNYFRCRGNSGKDMEVVNLNLSTAMDFKFYADIETDNILDKHRLMADGLIGKLIEVDIVVPWVSFGEGIRVVGES